MNKIFWMLDELIATTKPGDWKKVEEKSEELFSIIGNSEFNHVVVAPEKCIVPLAQQIQNEHFSTIIDLTENGWLSSSLHDIFPMTPVIKDLHISRVRDVSNPSLPTSGHIINLTPKEIDEIKKSSNLDKPLILDDVSFSGSSSELTMKLLNLNPKETSNAFLITNIGDLGANLGAKSRLDSLESKIFTGITINTSNGEDGWHVKDFVLHPTLERSLGLVVTIHEIIQKDGLDSLALNRLFKTDAIKEILFPFALPFEKIKELNDKGKFVVPKETNISNLKEGMHTTNPTLLTSPYFLKHISSELFRKNLTQVSETIHEIQFLTKDKENQTHSIEGFRKEIENNLFRGGIERNY